MRIHRKRGREVEAGELALAMVLRAVASPRELVARAPGQSAARELMGEAADLLVSAGDAARERGELLLAETCYDAYLGFFPHRWPIWIQLGQMRKEMGRLAAAAECYQRAHALAPEDAELRLQMGHVAKLMGQHDAAVGHYAAALQVRPTWTEPYRELAGAQATELAFDIARAVMKPGSSRRLTSGGELAIFTIVSRNYLAHARVLLESAATHYPEAQRFLVLVDREGLAPDEAPSGCHVLRADEIGIDDFEVMAFRYDVVELNTAVKPFAFVHLLATEGFARAIYFDPDIRIFERSPAILQALERATIVLTPHLCEPAGTRGEPDDAAIMRAGVFNLGFAAVRACEQSRRLLTWWAGHLQFKCLQRPEVGLCVDQKFLDLAPCLFEGVHIHRGVGANVAYWNLAERPLSQRDGVPTVAGEPLEFFHFSGFDPRRPRRLSKYTELYADVQDHELAGLLAAYAAELGRHGVAVWRDCPYGYARLRSGEPIPRSMRRYFGARFLTWQGDPFETFGAHLLDEIVSPAPRRLRLAGYAWELLSGDPMITAAVTAPDHLPDSDLADLMRLGLLEHPDLGPGLANRLAATIVEPIHLRAKEAVGARHEASRPEPAADVTLVADFEGSDARAETSRRLAEMLVATGRRIEVVALPGRALPSSLPAGTLPARFATGQIEISVAEPSKLAVLAQWATSRRNRVAARLAVALAREMGDVSRARLLDAGYARVWPVDLDRQLSTREEGDDVETLPVWLGSAPPRAADKCRERLGLDPAAPLVICRVERADDEGLCFVEHLLPAFADARRIDGPWAGARLLIWTGPLWSAPEALRRLDRALAPLEWARQLCADLAPDQARLLAAAASAVVVPPASPTPYCAADAAAAGAPVISREPSGLPEPLAGEVAAVLCSLASAGSGAARSFDDAGSARLAAVLRRVAEGAAVLSAGQARERLAQRYAFAESTAVLAARLRQIARLR